MIELAVLAFGRSPYFPSIWLVEDEFVLPVVQSRLGSSVFFKAVKIFQKQEPRGLLGIIELGSTTVFSPQYVVDAFEGLFEYLVS